MTADPIPGTTAEPFVLGIDPSLTATGIASSAGWTHVTGIPGHRTDSYDQRLARINVVAAGVTNCVHPRVTGLVVMEGPAYSRGADPSAFDRTALWWVIYRSCRIRGVPVAVVPPNVRAMYATGRGNAAKGAVIDAAARRWPQYATDGDHNVCDAVVLMAMGLDHLGTPLSDMPANCRRALDRVAWPENGDPQ